ncbi:MAG: agmatinase [Anaerolineaceae bacterium]|nr:agmatinase [Anaerolineaceae bacterium]
MQSWDDFMEKPDAIIGLQGISYDENSSFQKGSAKAPPIIRAAFNSGSANLWSENGTDLGAEGIFVDTGDLSPEAGQDMFVEIENGTTCLLKHKLKPLSLGGDHSITFPIMKAISLYFPRLSILHFDAHPDLYDHYEGNYHSHASPFARIMEAGLVERLVQIGIRTLTGHQREQAEKFGVEIVEMKDWSDEMMFEFSTPLYISFDMDCLDPAFAPGVSHWEPGGFSTRQVLGIIQKICSPIAGADIVEFNPCVEDKTTAMVAAKVLKEIAAKMLEE